MSDTRKGKRINFWFTSDQIKLLDDIKEKKGLKNAEAVREAMKQFALMEDIEYGDIDATEPNMRKIPKVSTATSLNTASSTGAHDTEPPQAAHDVFSQIVEWNQDRNIPQEFDLAKEAGHIAEELSELLRSTCEEEAIDAFADLIVFSVGAMWKLGYDPTEAMKETLKEINSRGGSFDSEIGKWVKKKSGREYKAQYSKA